MRNMSFMLTTEPVRKGIKTVTRRNGWWFIKPGDLVMAVEKCQGLKKGEKQIKIRIIRIKSSRESVLNTITKTDLVKEGFPNMRIQDFVLMYCRHNKCNPNEVVNRIEFEYVLYNHKSIKEHEGKYIELCFKSKTGIHKSNGIIVSSDRDGIIFNINNSMRKELKSIRILYENIILVDKPKK
jgi:hypothetical protein